MATWRKTSFTEFVSEQGHSQSPIFQFGQDLTRCTRIIDIPWSGLGQGIIDFLGYSQVSFDGSGNGYVSRVIPHTFTTNANFSMFNNLWAMRFSRVDGFGAPSGGAWIDGNGSDSMPLFSKARCTVEYDMIDYDVLSDSAMVSPPNSFKDGNGNPDESTWSRYCIVKTKPRATYLMLPKGVMNYVNATVRTNNAGINLQPGKIVPSTTVEIMRIGVPERAVASQGVCRLGTGQFLQLISTTNFAANSTAYLDLYIGTVNDRIFNDYPQGSLLYTAADLRPHRDPFGKRVFDVTLFLDFSPQYQVPLGGGAAIAWGHNIVPALNADGNVGWVEIGVGSTPVTNFIATPLPNKSIYDFKDFRNLFYVPAQAT